MRIYIESTIPSYAVARPSRDLLQSARQQLTKEWWESDRGGHALFTSEFVIGEISAGEAAMTRLRLEAMAGVTILRSTDSSLSLARNILGSGILPPGAEFDAAHIALATAHSMDVLLTWNCRHIANAAIQARLRRLVQESGYLLPQLCTLDVLIGELDE